MEELGCWWEGLCSQGCMMCFHPEYLNDWSLGAKQYLTPWKGSVNPGRVWDPVWAPEAPWYSLRVCPGLRDLVATQLSMGRLNGCCTLVRMIL